MSTYKLRLRASAVPTRRRTRKGWRARHLCVIERADRVAATTAVSSGDAPTGTRPSIAAGWVAR